MTTLYIRDVPPDVAQTLKQRAAAAGMSLSSYVTAQLTAIAARPTNAEIAERLRVADRSDGPSTDEIVDMVHTTRR